MDPTMFLLNIIVLGSLFLLLIVEEIRHRRQARHTEAVRRSLLAIVYQIRTPLTTISKFNSFLRLGEFGKLTLGQTEALCRMESSLDDVFLGLNRFLIASKLEDGAVDVALKKCDVRDAIVTAIHAVEGVVSERKHRVVFAPGSRPLSVRADPLTLHGIFDELLLNSAAYSHPGGTITLSAHKKKSKVIVTVKDTGVGIAREDQMQIFQKFFRSPRTSAMHPGSGLGLSFVQQLVCVLHGSIHFVSTENKGTTFTVSLPSA